MATTLSTDEQRFFETGEIQSGMTPEPAHDPIAASGVGALAAPVEPQQAIVQPAVAQPAVPAADDAAEILRRTLAETQQQVAVLQHQISLQQQAAAQTKVEPAPDKNTDPLGAMFHHLEEVNKTVVGLQQQINQQTQQNQQFNTFQQFHNQVQTMRDQFAVKTPDFTDAYTHLRDARTADLRAYGMTPDAIQQVIFREEVALSENAIRQGRNPAEVVYEMAKRHGYTPKTPAAAAATPDQKLDAIQKAQAASRQLPKTPQNEDLTLEGLKSSSDADLNKLVMDPKAWSKIVGADQYPL